jgi:regulator of cell morphogenesis and NO signaling
MTTTQPSSLAARADWSERPLRDLIRYIVDGHHVFTREALDALLPLAHEVARAHGGRYPHLVEVVGLLRELEDDIRSHLAEEEQMLFPLIEELDIASRAPGGRTHRLPPELEDGPVRALLLEHDHAGDVLRALRATTRDYAAPGDASEGHKALLSKIAALDEDLRRHMELEGGVLIPRARALAGL